MRNSQRKLVFGFIFAFLMMLIYCSTLNAQETKSRYQSWRYGLTGALQYNTASLGWQSLHSNITSSIWDANFHSPKNDIELTDGTGWGFYGGLFGAYLSEDWWGIQLRISYDERRALIEDLSVKQIDPTLPTPSFDTKMSYLSFAPSLRIDQNLIPDLYFHAGFFINANLKGTYVYKPDVTKSETEPEIDISDRNMATYGIQGGLGYDFTIAQLDDKNSVIISPIFDVSWLVDQRKSDGIPSQNSIDDIWSTISYRLGVIIAIDYNPLGGKLDDFGEVPLSTVKNPPVSIELPEDNTLTTKNIKGYFPLHPYVFFNKANQNIPPRYTLLTKAEAQNFKESDLESFIKGDLTTKQTNIDQLMKTYYNILNIYGDRMRKNPDVKLTLRGTDPEEIEGEASAQKVKKYLVDIFGIDPDRIDIIVEPPYAPSGSEYTEESSKRLIADENRRVKFLFNDPIMRKPVEYTISDESSIDNDLIFTVDREIPLKSWDITITGEGKTMYFGPFAYYRERINPSELMRFLENGKYNARVVVTDKSGNKTEENKSFKLSKDTEIKNASRYLMIFNYNDSKSVASYEEKIRNEITPGLEVGDRVIIHGHTDKIGTIAGNKKLSKERADLAKSIMDDQLKKENKVINVKALGIGQSKTQYTFNNSYPEGRMYNRNVFIEVIK